METVFLCTDCQTPVGPARLRCSKCLAIREDKALDWRLMMMGRNEEARWIAAIDRLLAETSANAR